jgi:flavin reductase (DIM6/NTAB) family NADH-FMN oxidoreductase RutF
MIVDPKETTNQKLHGYLLGAVVPRPIAFVSTIDKEGRVNLSPFSFFNVFSSNPPVMVFSPSRRGRDKTTKHTYDNVKQVPEAVINIVNYSMVEQASLASGEYPLGINEFVKAGFTEEPSQRVAPPRVKESPVAFECKVSQVIELGTGGAAGNLVICEVLLMHVRDEVLDAQGRIDPLKLDAVARMGQEYYCRVIPESIITVPRPGEKPGVGFEAIPEWIRKDSSFSGNDLARLASISQMPSATEMSVFMGSPAFESMLANGREASIQMILNAVRSGKVAEAWSILLIADRVLKV